MLRKPLGKRFRERAPEVHMAVGHAAPHFSRRLKHLLVLAAVAPARRKLDRVHPLLFLAEMRLGVRNEVIERGQQLDISRSADSIELGDELAMRVVHRRLADRQLLGPGKYRYWCAQENSPPIKASG
jgi:hypothetical protein